MPPTLHARPCTAGGETVRVRSCYTTEAIAGHHLGVYGTQRAASQSPPDLSIHTENGEQPHSLSIHTEHGRMPAWCHTLAALRRHRRTPRP